MGRLFKPSASHCGGQKTARSARRVALSADVRRRPFRPVDCWRTGASVGLVRQIFAACLSRASILMKTQRRSTQLRAKTPSALRRPLSAPNSLRQSARHITFPRKGTPAPWTPARTRPATNIRTIPGLSGIRDSCSPIRPRTLFSIPRGLAAGDIRLLAPYGWVLQITRLRGLRALRIYPCGAVAHN